MLHAIVKDLLVHINGNGLPLTGNILDYVIVLIALIKLLGRISPAEHHRKLL